MAQGTRDFLEEYQNLQDLSQKINQVNLNQPNDNIITQEASTYELLQLQAETQAKALTEAINFMQNMIPLQEAQDNDGLIGNAGDKINVQRQKTHLKEIAEKNNLVTRMLQTKFATKFSQQSYFDTTRTPICAIPPQIATGDRAEVQDSALKLINNFTGDTDQEAEKLKSFLRTVYDVAQTNRLTTNCTAAIIKRKLQGTARKLIDAYEEELGNIPDRPNLLEIVLKLETRYMADMQPEVANARLAMLKKTTNQTYQALEGEISELVTLAARGEKGDKTTWMKQRKIEIFKQAIDEDDRKMLIRENQSRTLNGLGELNLSEAVDFLIKTYSERNAFVQANQLKNYRDDNESINKVKETEKTDEKDAETKKNIDEQKIKDEIYRIVQGNRGKPFRGRFRGRFRGNRGRFNNGRRGNNRQNGNNSRNSNSNYNGSYNSSNSNWNNGNSNWNNGNQQKPNNTWNNDSNNRRGNGRGWRGNNRGPTRNNGGPRKFITPEIAGVQPNNCLKCDSPTHKFQETDKCIYGQSKLMTQPCFNCKRGAHNSSMCIKGHQSTIGATQPKEPLDPNFSKWPENSKSAQENKEQLYNLFPKNDWMPSLFPE